MDYSIRMMHGTTLARCKATDLPFDQAVLRHEDLDATWVGRAAAAVERQHRRPIALTDSERSLVATTSGSFSAALVRLLYRPGRGRRLAI